MIKAFDNEKYLKLQSENILNRVEKFDNKLYLEFGGKLFDDYHASRVLPGFLKDSKLRMLLTLKEKVEVIVVISSKDIEKNKIRGDLNINYESEVLRLIDAFRASSLYVGSVCINQYHSTPQVINFTNKLNNLGIKINNCTFDTMIGTYLLDYVVKDDISFVGQKFNAEIPLYEDAFAMTIHKSQGSGFNNVMLVMPDKEVAILTRELIYTGITRTKNKLVILSKENIIRKSLVQKTFRYSGLQNRYNARLQTNNLV